MPLYVGDYLKDTMHLSTEEHGAYMLLLMASWTRGGRFPDDDVVIARLAASDLRAWRRMRPVIAPFFEIEAGEWFHPRVLRELERAHKLSEKRKVVGSLGGKASASKRQANAQAIAQPNAEAIAQAKVGDLLKQKARPSPSQSPTTSVHEPSLPSPLPASGEIGEGDFVAGNLRRGTWEGWKRHLAQKGKGMSPIAEQHNLARLPKMFADLEATVQHSLANNWLNLHAPEDKTTPKVSKLAHRQRIADSIYGSTHDETRSTDDAIDITPQSVRIGT